MKGTTLGEKEGRTLVLAGAYSAGAVALVRSVLSGGRAVVVSFNSPRVGCERFVRICAQMGVRHVRVKYGFDMYTEICPRYAVRSMAYRHTDRAFVVQGSSCFLQALAKVVSAVGACPSPQFNESELLNIVWRSVQDSHGEADAESSDFEVVGSPLVAPTSPFEKV